MKVENESPITFEFKNSLKERSPYSFLNKFPVEFYITRPLASIIVRLVINTTVTPNQITYFAFFLGIASAALFVGGNPIFFLAAGITAQLGSIFDCADGMLARARNKHSRYGAFLDLFFDRVSDFLVMACLSIGWFRFTGNQLFLILGLLASGLYMLQVSLYYLMNEYLREKRTGQAGEPRGLAIFLLMVFSIINRLDLFILIILVMACINILFKTFRFIEWRRNSSSTEN